eukprot:2560698-Prymnesium_polylepis.1
MMTEEEQREVMRAKIYKDHVPGPAFSICALVAFPQKEILGSRGVEFAAPFFPHMTTVVKKHTPLCDHLS